MVMMVVAVTPLLIDVHAIGTNTDRQAATTAVVMVVPTMMMLATMCLLAMMMVGGLSRQRESASG